MMKNKKLFYGILIVVVVVVGIGLFILSKPTTAPVPEDKTQEEYYGSSTYGQCQTDNDCFVSGCNFEICQSKAEESLVSICILPPKPTPKELNYECKCVNQRCQWSK